MKTELIANVCQIGTNSQYGTNIETQRRLNPIKNMKFIMDDAPKKESQGDVKKALKETQQEVMIDLALKTNNFLEKLKAETKKNRVAF